MKTLKQIYTEYTPGDSIFITGRADGSKKVDPASPVMQKYNQRLASLRANNVADVLLKMGVHRKDIHMNTRLSLTYDRSFRRVDIELQKR